jgi:hypothetical protein
VCNDPAYLYKAPVSNDRLDDSSLILDFSGAGCTIRPEVLPLHYDQICEVHPVIIVAVSLAGNGSAISAIILLLHYNKVCEVHLGVAVDVSVTFAHISYIVEVKVLLVFLTDFIQTAITVSCTDDTRTYHHPTQMLGTGAISGTVLDGMAVVEGFKYPVTVNIIGAVFAHVIIFITAGIRHTAGITCMNRTTAAAAGVGAVAKEGVSTGISIVEIRAAYPRGTGIVSTGIYVITQCVIGCAAACES